MAPGMPGGLPFPLQQLLRPAMPGTTPVFQPGTAPPTAAPAPPPGTASVAPPGSPASASAAAAPAPNATAHFEPFRFDATVLGEFTASLILDSGVDVVSTQPLQLQFDPKLLQLTDVSAGDLFSKDGGTPVFTKDIKNDEGLATIQIGRQPGATGVNAPGTLLTFKFQAIARGAATVNVLNVTVRNSLARAVGSSHPQLTVNIK
jgi:general secretion pathway protein D